MRIDSPTATGVSHSSGDGRRNGQSSARSSRSAGARLGRNRPLQRRRLSETTQGHVNVVASSGASGASLASRGSSSGARPIVRPDSHVEEEVQAIREEISTSARHVAEQCLRVQQQIIDLTNDSDTEGDEIIVIDYRFGSALSWSHCSNDKRSFRYHIKPERYQN